MLSLSDLFLFKSIYHWKYFPFNNSVDETDLRMKVLFLLQILFLIVAFISTIVNVYNRFNSNKVLRSILIQYQINVSRLQLILEKRMFWMMSFQFIYQSWYQSLTSTLSRSMDMKHIISSTMEFLATTLQAKDSIGMESMDQTF